MDTRVETLSPLDFSAWVNDQLARVERALDLWVSVDSDTCNEHHAPAGLMDAMR